MFQLSLPKPVNEPFGNFAHNESDWSQFANAAKNLPRGKEIPLIIGGKKVYSSKKGVDVNPSTLEPLATFQEATAEHAKAAIDAALKAREHWSTLSPATRLQKFRDLEYVLSKWKYETCATTAVECGYTSVEVSVSWAEMMDFVRFNSYFYTELLQEKLGDGIDETNQLQLRPLKGFTCAVTPFNFPIAIGFNLPLVMALTGNTVIWKPSSDAVLTSYLLMCAIEEAGFPPGVINFLTGGGHEFLPEVLKHPELTCLNFTGSFATARTFGNYLSNTEFKRENFPRFIAETGGKDFSVIDKDVDIKDTATLILQGALGRSGQKCSANSVALVHKDVWPKIKEELVAQLKNIKMGNPLEKDTFLGPVINERAFNKIRDAIERAKKDTANCKLVYGGNCDSKKGYYIEPTFFEVTSDSHELLHTEIFGPVVGVKTWSTLEEVTKTIQLHNYRLTGSVVSKNEHFLEKAIPILSEYAGNFYVNRKTTGAIVNQQPFGGDGASGTNCKAGGKWYLLNFVSQGTITRRHARTTTAKAFDHLG